MIGAGGFGRGLGRFMEFLALWLGAPIMQETLQRTA